MNNSQYDEFDRPPQGHAESEYEESICKVGPVFVEFACCYEQELYGYVQYKPVYECVNRYMVKPPQYGFRIKESYVVKP